MYNFILGADECGYGAAFGMLTVCGLIAPKEWRMEGLRDSKKLSAKQRIVLADKLYQDKDIKYCIVEKSNDYIDKVGLYLSLKECYREIAAELYNDDCLFIVDGNLKLDEYLKNIRYESIIKADDKIPQVSAASIIGKTFRDSKIISLHDKYPQYNLNSNMGYLSKSHIAAIKEFGLTDMHRKSYNLKCLNTK